MVTGDPFLSHAAAAYAPYVGPVGNPALHTSALSSPLIGSPKTCINSDKDSILVGTNAGPLLKRPITTGPTGGAVLGRCELSISLIKTPGETNLKFFADIVRTLLMYSLGIKTFFL